VVDSQPLPSLHHQGPLPSKKIAYLHQRRIEVEALRGYLAAYVGCKASNIHITSTQEGHRIEYGTAVVFASWGGLVSRLRMEIMVQSERLPF